MAKVLFSCFSLYPAFSGGGHDRSGPQRISQGNWGRYRTLPVSSLSVLYHVLERLKWKPFNSPYGSFIGFYTCGGDDAGIWWNFQEIKYWIFWFIAKRVMAGLEPRINQDLQFCMKPEKAKTEQSILPMSSPFLSTSDCPSLLFSQLHLPYKRACL